MSKQQQPSTNAKVIETIHITPNKEMPKDIFIELYRISMFMELMERTPDGKVIWDEHTETIYAPETSEVIWRMIQDDMLEVTLEVPKEFVDQVLL